MSEHPTSKPVQAVHRGEAFFQGIAHYVRSDGGRAVSALLHEPRYTVKEADIAYRVANHWESVGLLPETRLEGKGWRKFGLLDLVWLRVLTDLRLFGLSLEQLGKVKAWLEDQYVFRKGTSERTTFWEYYVALAIVRRQPTRLLVFADGTAEPAYFEQYIASLQYLPLSHHINLNINQILQRMMPNSNLSPVSERTVTVDDNEFEALFLLRTGNYDSVTLKGRGGKVRTIEVEQTVSTDEKIVDLLNDAAFQDIEIKRRDGKTVSVKRKILTQL